MPKRIAVYGSLRPADYNYQRFKDAFQDDVNPVDGVVYKVPGFKLFNLGSYPGINKGEPTDEIAVELLECSDQCYNAIERMELNAGYSVEEVQVNNQPVSIFVYNRVCNENNRVKGGDWIEYKKSLRRS